MAIKEILSDIKDCEKELSELKKELQQEIYKKNEIPKVIDQKITNKYSAYHGDCVEIVKGLPSDSIHFSVFSPPFSSLFTYSNSLRDMGNSKDNEFYQHFEYLVPELYRTMMPGRIVALHCMNLPMTLTTDGVIGIKDFRGDLIRLFSKFGFIFHAEFCIWKDPLLQAVRTKTLSLAHKQVVKDSSKSGSGFPDYIVAMKKPGENPEPINRKRGFEYYIGDEPEPKNPKNDDPSINKYSHYVWQKYASPVWFDINQTNTLNIKQARDKDDERHICPLQLDTIARCIELWSNEGDTVLSPFGGIGSEGYEALRMKRKAILIELKKSYYDVMVKNLNSASKQHRGFFE